MRQPYEMQESDIISEKAVKIKYPLIISSTLLSIAKLLLWESMSLIYVFTSRA
jgi:hypothetical protein